jgi:hypothetical protein
VPFIYVGRKADRRHGALQDIAPTMLTPDGLAATQRNDRQAANHPAVTIFPHRAVLLHCAGWYTACPCQPQQDLELRQRIAALQQEMENQRLKV